MRLLLALVASTVIVTAIVKGALWELERERQARVEAELQNAGIPTT